MFICFSLFPEVHFPKVIANDLKPYTEIVWSICQHSLKLPLYFISAQYKYFNYFDFQFSFQPNLLNWYNFFNQSNFFYLFNSQRNVTVNRTSSVKEYTPTLHGLVLNTINLTFKKAKWITRLKFEKSVVKSYCYTGKTEHECLYRDITIFRLSRREERNVGQGKKTLES